MPRSSSSVSGEVKQGAPIFRLDSSRQEAAAETARRKIAETEAALVVARSDILEAEGKIQEARSAYQQAIDELETKRELYRRNPGNVAVPGNREAGERRRRDARGRSTPPRRPRRPPRLGSPRCCRPKRPAPRRRSRRPRWISQKTVVRAGVDGRVEQFALRVGDIVNPLMRPAGVLIPEGAGRKALQAGFGQIEAQVMKVGMVAEVTCVSKPWTVIPMVVTEVQDYIAAGQFRGGEQLIDPQQVARPGTILVFLEPLYEGGLDGVTPGSSCIANAYTSNHELIDSGDIGTVRGFVLHAVDAVGLVHAMILRIQALASADPDPRVRRTLKHTREERRGEHPLRPDRGAFSS